MQVQVANIRTDRARISQTDLRVHVSAIHIKLSTASVNDLAHLLDIRLEDTVCRRIGDHTCRQMLLVGLCLLTEVLQVDVSVLVAFYRHCLVATLNS